MKRSIRTRRRGFTLLEMMIVVAIIGVLAAIAIPQFRTYQFRSKRSEGYANLASLAKAQESYFAEFGDYVGVVSEPAGLTGQPPGPRKRASAGWDNTNFGTVGWAPEGDVFFDYDTNTSDTDGACCQACFTAAAYGDLDGNGLLGVLVYVKPDANGGTCLTLQGGPLAPPVDPASGNVVLGQVARHFGTDTY
jgi:prepilin-type N-terminal cleavage/methylation domain-containing protein